MNNSFTTYLALTLITLVIVGNALVYAKPSVKKGDYLVYDIVSKDIYYGVNKTMSLYFKNATYWSRVQLEVLEVNATHVIVNSTLIDTNNTAATNKIGSSNKVTIDTTKELSETLSIIIDPSLLPENHVYENRTEGMSPYGPYELYLKAVYDEKGILKDLHTEYTLKTVMQNIGNITYRNIADYRLIWTNIEGIDVGKPLNPIPYNPPPGAEKPGVTSLYYIIGLAIVFAFIMAFLLYRKKHS